MDCSPPGFSVHHQLLELTQIHVHRVGDAIQPSHPLSSSSPPLNLSPNQSLFQWVSFSYQVAKYWAFSFSISPTNEYLGLISFRIVWFDLLAVQETLKSLLQHHSLKALILWCSAFFMAQLSHPCTSLVAQMVKHLPTMQDTWVQSLGQEDLLGKEMATHSSTLAWKIPWTEELGRLQSTGSHRVGHDWSDLAAAAAAE